MLCVETDNIMAMCWPTATDWADPAGEAGRPAQSWLSTGLICTQPRTASAAELFLNLAFNPTWQKTIFYPFLPCLSVQIMRTQHHQQCVVCSCKGLTFGIFSNILPWIMYGYHELYNIIVSASFFICHQNHLKLLTFLFSQGQLRHKIKAWLRKKAEILLQFSLRWFF